MEKATKRFIGALRESPEFQKQALEYTREVEKYIAEIELENLQKEFKILELIKEIGIYVDLLKSYGVDIGKLGSRSIFSIREQVESAERGILSIPEKLKKHDNRTRPKRR